VTTVLRSTDEDLLALHERFPDRYPVLLESAGGSASLGRLDLLLALPGERLSQLPDGRLESHGIPSPASARFLDALDEWWRRERKVAVAASTDAPFCGGWFLYLGYELAQEIEPTLRLPPPRLPRAVAWRMRGAVLRDRDTGDTRCVAEEGAGDTLVVQLAEDLRSVQEARSRGVAVPVSVQGGALEQEPAVFVEGVHKALEAIARGDVYQANLSRPWRARLAPGVQATDLYRALRRANPAPFAGLAQLGDFAVLSSSPERLLRLERGIASTRPIAGTRPRGRDAGTDDSLRRELQLNEKERAEHVMLVDLERNDLGRICRAGTVQVDEYMTIESYATVHHIVSNVRGELRDDVTPGQAIAAVFPGGTITGCPKVRCMQLLADFEREPRDAYTGSMGYLGADGTLDLNILIRTLVVRGSEIEFRTGAGIVADSDPEAELAETRAKARGLLRALGGEP
jgi:anthranilate synthase component 1